MFAIETATLFKYILQIIEEICGFKSRDILNLEFILVHFILITKFKTKGYRYYSPKNNSLKNIIVIVFNINLENQSYPFFKMTAVKHNATASSSECMFF